MDTSRESQSVLATYPLLLQISGLSGYLSWLRFKFPRQGFLTLRPHFESICVDGINERRSIQLDLSPDTNGCFRVVATLFQSLYSDVYWQIIAESEAGFGVARSGKTKSLLRERGEAKAKCEKPRGAPRLQDRADWPEKKMQAYEYEQQTKRYTKQGAANKVGVSLNTIRKWLNLAKQEDASPSTKSI